METQTTTGTGKAAQKPPSKDRRASKEGGKPSLAGALFHGAIASDLLLPYPEQKPEEKEILQMTLAALAKMAKDADVSRIEEEKRIPSELLQQMREMGLFGVIIPEEYGGFGLSTTAYLQIMTATSLIDTSLTVTVGAHQSIGLKALLMFGSDEQKRTYLPKLAAGESIAAFGLTEPGAGSDVRSLKTTADLSADGTHYVLNGSKIWITNGGIADFFTVFARTHHPERPEGKRERLTAFIVTRDMAGFSSGPEEKKMGLLGSSTTSLHFENVKVPRENVIGVPGEGFKVAMSVLNNGRLGLAGACALGSKMLVHKALEHATQRRQFGKTLAEFGLIQSKLANMAIDIYAAESMTRIAAHLMDRGDCDYYIETAICKVFATEMEWRIVNETLQIAGGTGYMKEYPYEKAVRDSRIFMIWEGANEILRLFIGLSGVQGPGEELKAVSAALKKPLADVLGSLGVLRDFGKRWVQRRVTTPERLEGAHPLLAREAALFDKYVAAFAAEVETTLLREGKNIVHNEYAVKRLADVVIDLYAMASVISRTTRDLERGGDQAARSALLAKAFFRKARRRIAENLRRMGRNDDELETRIAEQLVETGFPDIGVFT